MSGNKIGDAGIGALCKKLQRNAFLETLDLAYNDLREGAAQDMAEMLALNASLTSVFCFLAPLFLTLSPSRFCFLSEFYFSFLFFCAQNIADTQV